MKRILLRHNVTGLEISFVTDAAELQSDIAATLKASGVTLGTPAEWTGQSLELWPQKT